VGQSILEAARGSLLASSLNLAVALAWTGLFLMLWALSASRLLVDEGTSLRRASLTVDSSENTPSWTRGSEIKAALGKEIRYLVRSPSRRSVLVLNTVMGTAFALLQLLQRESRPGGMVLVAPLAGLLFSLSAIDNQLGYDSAPLWMEVAAGGPRRAELLGRSASWLPLVAAPALPTAVVIAALTGGWRYVPVAIVLAVVGAGVPLGVGVMISVRAPFPIPDTGKPFSNPYANTGRGCAVGLLVLAALVIDSVLLVPAVVLVIAALRVSYLWLCGAVVPVALWSIAIWWIGANQAARYVRGREPELLAALVERT
jgi:ABC-2 type transport system permease protein